MWENHSWCTLNPSTHVNQMEPCAWTCTFRHNQNLKFFAQTDEFLPILKFSTRPIFFTHNPNFCASCRIWYMHLQIRSRLTFVNYHFNKVVPQKVPRCAGWLAWDEEGWRGSVWNIIKQRLRVLVSGAYRDLARPGHISQRQVPFPFREMLILTVR